MGTVVRDIVSSMELVAGYGGTRCCGKKSHDDVRLRSIQSGSRWLKDIRQRYWGDLCRRVCGRMTAHGWSLWI